MLNDPGELVNLANSPEYQDVMNKHRRKLQDWISLSADTDAETFAVRAVK